MIRYACTMAMAILLLDASTGWSQQQYLYTPTALTGEAKAQARDGVLVQDVTVQKGDTLSGISRRFSGHGTYYPQILLFNDIKDPNLIYPGNIFKVPLPKHAVSGQIEKVVQKSAQAAAAGGNTPAPATEISSHDLKKVDSAKEKKRSAKEKSADTKKQSSAEKQHKAAGVPVESASGQKLFERGVKAYRQDDCRTALELFDRFLAENQASPLAADASLYKAECYLKLSSQN